MFLFIVAESCKFNVSIVREHIFSWAQIFNVGGCMNTHYFAMMHWETLKYLVAGCWSKLADVTTSVWLALISLLSAAWWEDQDMCQHWLWTKKTITNVKKITIFSHLGRYSRKLWVYVYKLVTIYKLNAYCILQYNSSNRLLGILLKTVRKFKFWLASVNSIWPLPRRTKWTLPTDDRQQHFHLLLSVDYSHGIHVFAHVWWTHDAVTFTQFDINCSLGSIKMKAETPMHFCRCVTSSK